MPKKAVNWLLMFPVLALFALALFYVITGFDPLSGDDGNRWLTLGCISLVGVFTLAALNDS